MAPVPPQNSLGADGSRENKSAGHLPGDVLGNWAITTSYGAQWRRARALWKDNDKTFQFQLVPYQNMLGVNRNHRNNVTFRIYYGATTPGFGPKGLVRPRVARPPPWPPSKPLTCIYSVAINRLEWVLLILICSIIVSPSYGL